MCPGNKRKRGRVEDCLHPFSSILLEQPICPSLVIRNVTLIIKLPCGRDWPEIIGHLSQYPSDMMHRLDLQKRPDRLSQ